MKTDFDALKQLIDQTIYSREVHEEAATIRQRPKFFNPIQKAWAFFVLSNTSIYGMLDGVMVTPSDHKKSPSSAFYSKVKLLSEEYAHRFVDVFVDNRDAIYVIDKNDAESTFMFVDPPYFQSDMGHYGGYTIEDYERLLLKLANLKGKFMLTSYPSDILDAYVSANNWTKFEKDMPLGAGSKGKRKTEVFVTNY